MVLCSHANTDFCPAICPHLEPHDVMFYDEGSAYTTCEIAAYCSDAGTDVFCSIILEDE